MGGSADATGRVGHFSAWRAVTALPAIFGSAVLVLIAAAGLGAWEGLVLLGWLGSGLLVLTRRGERWAVRLVCGYRRPSVAQRRLLSAVWAAAVRDAGRDPSDVDLYVLRRPGRGAYATGRHSVALTTGALAENLTRTTGRGHLHPILCHELGHHATGATRFALPVAWLAWPWRWVSGFVLGLARALSGGRRVGPATCLVAAAGVVVATVQAAQAQAWLSVGVLVALVVLGVGMPLADAAFSRAAERAADRFTAELGFGGELAAALQSWGEQTQRGWLARKLDRHPPVQDRVEDLLWSSWSGGELGDVPAQVVPALEAATW